MAEHKHGSMDTTAQEKTFAGFIRLVTWGTCISIGILVFMALVNA
ncbi:MULTISPECIES: aa3-type cytochrome c oxidase subunit IV [Pseudotabrizicola]|nr:MULTISPECIES: aa3-type cytochrome c oxidase subunit IV [Pseudotabrizicola]MDO9640718.1 aa3-type cytochrome c oxidase subunit IV [Pseudotabrizicola sp.]